jgi:Fe-S-cluster-containing hydrogenase component 2
MSLLSFAERLASIDRSAVTFSPERCLYAQDKDSSCEACYRVCPAQAITAGPSPAFNPQKCQSCLACLPVCPTGAFSADDAVPSLLSNAARLEAAQVELICSLHPHPDLGAVGQAEGLKVRGCLAGLGAGAGMALAASGFEHIIYRCDACGECPWGALAVQIRAQAAEVGHLLAPWRKTGVPLICNALGNPINRPLWKTGNQSVSRRDFFRMALQPTKVSAARAIDNGEAILPRQPGRDRARKLKAALALGEPLERAAVLPKSDFARLVVSDACTACGVCARVCPTQAIGLVMDETKKRFNLVFKAQNCVDCGFCARACTPKAIQMNGLPAFEQVFRTQASVTVQAGDLVRCERCNTLIAAKPDTHLCPLCQFRQANPFGSKFPLGFKPPMVQKKNPNV